MELRHLKYFVTVAEELNISRASARLRVSQPAVSRQIRDLEDEVGAKLFIRDPTGLKLTAAGETFFAHARDILRRSAESLKAMQAFGKRTSEAITLSYIPTALPSFLTGALRTFGDQHPNVAVHLREMPPRQQIDALRKGEVDMAFIGNPCRELKNEFNLVVLKRVLISVALPDNHLLALRKQVELSKLSEEEFIGLSEDRFPGRNAMVSLISFFKTPAVCSLGGSWIAPHSLAVNLSGMVCRWLRDIARFHSLISTKMVTATSFCKATRDD